MVASEDLVSTDSVRSATLTIVESRNAMKEPSVVMMTTFRSGGEKRGGALGGAAGGGFSLVSAVMVNPLPCRRAGAGYHSEHCSSNIGSTAPNDKKDVLKRRGVRMAEDGAGVEMRVDA